MPVKVHIESLTTDEFNCARRGRTDRMRGLANKHPDGHWRWWIQVRSVERRGAYGGRECIFWIDLIGHQDKGEGSYKECRAAMVKRASQIQKQGRL